MGLIMLCMSTPAQEDTGPVEINGDVMEMSLKENKVSAQGNVSVKRQDVVLYCDELEYYKDSKIAMATGNVVLVRQGQRLVGDRLEFNFGTMKGDFIAAKVYANPFYGSGNKITRLDEKHLRIEKGYLTTCELDHPHFRLYSKKIDVFPQDKATARNVRLLVGKLPMMYMPKYTQDLTRKEPAVTYVPGYNKQWGAFLLTGWRFRLNEYLSGVLHLDYRQRKDLAEGLDLDYKTKSFGSGMIRTYYMNERNTSRKNFLAKQPDPTIEHEKFRGQWLHKWAVDETTHAIWQYYKLSDKDFLKNYFENEYNVSNSPQTYALLTKTFPSATLSLLVESRVNRFESKVERLPEVSLDMGNQEIGETGFYVKHSTTYTNFSSKEASPSELRKETMRVDMDNEISYPMKISVVELRPFAGGKQTYYSKTKDQSQYDVIRGIFRTGADVSSKFYRVFDVFTDKFGLDINRLRHVVTPTVAYFYAHDPTVMDTTLDSFDSVDPLTRLHSINFGLEQKLQTKRDRLSADLLRVLIGSDFKLKEDPGKGGFNNVTSDVELTPYQWLGLYFDSNYNTVSRRLDTANFDLYLNPNSKEWFARLGKRYNADVNDLVTAEVAYRLNPKWQVRTYQRFDATTGNHEEQEYTVRRDLHCWLMDINYNHTAGAGDEIWLVFTLKSFPDFGFDFGTGFNKRKPGSNNTIEQ